MATDNRAAKFYGGAAPSTPTAAPVTPRDATEVLYRKPTSAPPASRPRDAIELFYGADPAKAFATVFRKYEADLFDIGLTAEELAREQADYATTVRQLGVRHDVGERFYRLWAETRISQARHPASAEEMATQAQARSLETRQALRERFGPEDADAWLSKVQTFVAATPALATLFAFGGLERLDVTEALVEHLAAHPVASDAGEAGDEDGHGDVSDADEPGDDQ